MTDTCSWRLSSLFVCTLLSLSSSTSSGAAVGTSVRGIVGRGMLPPALAPCAPQDLPAAPGRAQCLCGIPLAHPEL